MSRNVPSDAEVRDAALVLMTESDKDTITIQALREILETKFQVGLSSKTEILRNVLESALLSNGSASSSSSSSSSSVEVQEETGRGKRKGL